MLENTRSLAVFAVVAETGSFRGAAKRLGFSPAAVSGHVSQLEERYGVALLYRSTRKLTLTETGRKIAGEGRSILDAEISARDIIEEHTRTPSGKLKVQAPSWLQNGAFVDEIARFSAQYPEITINLSFSDLNTDLIGEGIDLALRVGPVEDSALKCRHVVQIREALVASPAYLNASSLLESPEDLDKHWFVGFPAMQRSPVFVSQVSDVESYQKATVRSRFSVETRHFAYQFALRGMGLAILPDFLTHHHVARGELVEPLSKWQLPSKELLAIWPANAGKHSPSLALVNFLISSLVETAKFDEITRLRL
ncbi:LysR family transcriptional regulator [Tropicimonas sp. TH_r6]|uniref:LysR family transcriptional regulator n=1 Tax=Tropicimonas sp. TH_r6 TaxID=3082085 RepID=UPI002953264B|nr:LysR family transcriptional regulator [Tropicimonas sp. TH_r6]MDV7143582.1 LysR family transcriptional regulator [Tropicimonas sp. TH_r6]